MTSESINLGMFLVTVAAAFIAAHSLVLTREAISVSQTSNLQERQIDACAGVIGDYERYLSANRLAEMIARFESSLNNAGMIRGKWFKPDQSVDGVESSVPNAQEDVLKERSNLLASLAELEVYSGQDSKNILADFRSQVAGFRPIEFRLSAHGSFSFKKDTSGLEKSFEPLRKVCVDAMLGSKKGLL